MTTQLHPRPPSRRPPLGEATRRVNNTQQAQASPSKNSSIPHHESLKVDGLLQVRNHAPPSPLSQVEQYPPGDIQRTGSSVPGAANPRLSAISKEYVSTNSNRNSQISTVSTNASDGKRIKQTIGPWKLGKTLGKGATARVRLARHGVTGQEAAIKIVQKKNAQMSQAGSLAALDTAEAAVPDSSDGTRRMPVGIEREVAIMKLIQHPNIMKLYDIWENRTEIYLVLEFVDNGELFEHITTKGRLVEEEAIKYFRQIISAVGYCHSFNICHRDLKPENILLNKEGEIKIADFGMAALHQSPDHKLKTSCGSPHYAAPELIRGSNYRGDKVDIWSLGVILYATLAGRLPFDVEGSGRDWLGPLLAKIRKGVYEMAPEFSEDAANLIWRILQPNPRDRINLSQIWRHPLVRKYDYLDDLGRGSYPLSPTIKECGRPVLRRSDINKELLRHLRSMWHRLTEEQLMDALLKEEANDQKLFYSLLLKYRDNQLENYVPDLGYSTSDYHHAKPLALTKTYSTRNFTQVKSKGHGRQVSRFTVISNAAETEQSYDPFKASRPQHLNHLRPVENAKITIHRNQDYETGDDKSSHKSRVPSRVSVNSGTDRSRQRLAPPRGYASRSSLASSTRSRNSAPYVRATVGRKRGVSFSHIRRPSGGSQSMLSPNIRHDSGASSRNSPLVGVKTHGNDETIMGGDEPITNRYIRSRKGHSIASQPLLSGEKPSRTSQIWKEDVRQLSTSLAKDCDEAFNRTSIVSTTRCVPTPQDTATNSDSSGKRKYTPSTIAEANRRSKRASLDARPLPPPPSRSDSVKVELLEARKQAELRKTGGGESPRYLDRMVSHIDRLIQPSSPIQPYPDRRVTSAPLEAKYHTSARPLPSIHESHIEELSPRRASDPKTNNDYTRHVEGKTSRIASAPEPRAVIKNSLDDRFTYPGPGMRDTIRVVQQSSPGSPVKPPAPLTIRKKSSRGGPMPLMTGALDTNKLDNAFNRRRVSGLELRQQYNSGPKPEVTPELDRIEEDHNNDDDRYGHDSSSGTIVRKKSSWFRRSSKSGEDFTDETRAVATLVSQSSSSESNQAYPDSMLPTQQKNKGFSLRRLFKKRNSKPGMTVSPYDLFDDSASIQDSTVDMHRQSQNGRAAAYEDARSRQIEPQQNWLAKLFHVKPASKFICFSVSRRRARQEITTVLKEWRRYGIRDIQVDKERNIVFGKVGAKNFLDMKEVAFAGEVMTVIEHGKRSHFSIARFTQERGAASSFHKVVETLESVLKCRGMLLADERKKRMMIKTMNAV